MPTTLALALDTAAARHAAAILQDVRGRLAVPVNVVEVTRETVELAPRLGRADAALPPAGSFVRLAFQIERWTYQLSTHVRTVAPLRIGLHGTLVRTERRAADRRRGAGFSAWVDFGRGPRRLAVRDLSLGGLAIEVADGAPELGRSASLRLVGDDGDELLTLARVRHVTAEATTAVVGLAFGQLSPAACATLIQWLAACPATAP